MCFWICTFERRHILKCGRVRNRECETTRWQWRFQQPQMSQPEPEVVGRRSASRAREGVNTATHLSISGAANIRIWDWLARQFGDKAWRRPDCLLASMTSYHRSKFTRKVGNVSQNAPSHPLHQQCQPTPTRIHIACSHTSAARHDCLQAFHDLQRG